MHAPGTRSKAARWTAAARVRWLAFWLRAGGVFLLFTAVARALAGSPGPALCVGTAALLVAVLERRCGRHEAAEHGPGVEAVRAATARVLALELACDRSSSVLESLREGVVVVDGAGEVVLSNPAVRRALRRPDADLDGRVLWEELPGELGRAVHESWLALHEQRDARLSEMATVRHASIPCGDAFFDLTAVPVTSTETGHDFGTVFLFVDTTRSLELQRLKDRFLSSVSHELRTPLTSLCAYSELLRTMDPGAGGEWLEFVEVIHQESLHLSALVDGMFDFLELDSGNAEFCIEAVDAAQAVHEVVAMFGAAAEARSLAIEVDCEDVPAVRTDPGRLRQLCRHLVDNGVKFAPVGGRLRIRCGEVDDQFELRVEDSGPGVSENERSTVFERFTQLRDHLTDKPEGAGLGLSICRAIADRCGGRIWCEESELGGAAFVVRLPFAGRPLVSGLAVFDLPEPAPSATR